MDAIWEALKSGLEKFTFWDGVDILLVTVILYYVLKIASQTRAMQVIKGIGMIIIASQICEWLGLLAVSWIFNYIINIGAVLIVVLFQPELRRAFEQLGRNGRIIDIAKNHVDSEEMTDEIIAALTHLAMHKTGALIVMPKDSAVEDITETGTPIGGQVTAQLIETIFLVGTPLHDGALIIENGSVTAAGCFLPLTSNHRLPKHLGTRHRAAVGMSEVFDGVVFVVSEETGIISCARQGKLEQNIEAARIREIIGELSGTSIAKSILGRIKRGKDNEQTVAKPKE